jgi:pyridoxamine 5'-phosphate oxidase
VNHDPSIPWLEPLHEALEAEFHARNRIASLATADGQGNPHVRCIICRYFGPDGSIGFATDSRSEKMEQVRAKPRAELLFWLPSWREQFRIAGELRLLDEADPIRRRIWQELSAKSRALFLWPQPGLPREAGVVFAESTPTSGPIPASFAALVMSPEVVERLELSDHPHRRRRWRKANSWTAEEINP